MAKDEVKSEKTSKKQTNTKSDSKKKDQAPAKKSGKAKDQKKQPNKVAKYFKDLKSEFKKVVWPTKQQLMNNTAVVLTVIVSIGVVVGALDLGLGALLRFIVSK